jgi:hypothetical protein
VVSGNDAGNHDVADLAREINESLLGITEAFAKDFAAEQFVAHFYLHLLPRGPSSRQS